MHLILTVHFSNQPAPGNEDVWCGVTNSPTIYTPWYYVDTGNYVNCGSLLVKDNEADCNNIAVYKIKVEDSDKGSTVCKFKRAGHCEAKQPSTTFKAVCEQAALNGKKLVTNVQKMLGNVGKRFIILTDAEKDIKRIWMTQRFLTKKFGVLATRLPCAPLLWEGGQKHVSLFPQDCLKKDQTNV